MGNDHHKGQRELDEYVVKAKFCTACGACVNICPYRRSSRDAIVTLFTCDIANGRCYAYCPRTPSSLASLRDALFDPGDFSDDLGPVKAITLARARSEARRSASQHGGVVSTLASLALRSGRVQGMVLAERDTSLLSRPVLATDWRQVASRAGSTFVASQGVAAFNLAARRGFSSIGAVALPCHALAYAKMRSAPQDMDPAPLARPALVIGLFCSWAFSWEGLFRTISGRIDPSLVTGMEIPPRQHAVMQVFAGRTRIDFPLDEVKKTIRGSCHYCFDLTAEFADVSVGSALLQEDWETARRWNLVIVRSQQGLELVDLARKRGLLEFREAPEALVAELREAARGKKKRAIGNLRQRNQGDNLPLYLDGADPYLARVLEEG